MDKIDISSKTLNELESILLNMDELPFRAKQIYKWLNKDLVTDFESMTNLSKSLRAKLNNKCYITNVKLQEMLVSDKGNTSKYLFHMDNNTIIESVLMKYTYGNSVCVSTQSGCKMSCKFCASAIGGFERNLTTGEILAQVYNIQKHSKERVSNIVIMGVGEPLDNYNNVINFIKIINSKEGIKIGQRHITISTCGLVDKMYDLANENLQVTMAVSLHAPNDKIRNQIMPISNVYTINDILKASKYYSDKTGRRVTYEYAAIKGLNDSLDNAKELASKLKGSQSHVNLIPLNPIKEFNYENSETKHLQKFAKILESYGVDTTIRRKLGSDISAACGQLRKSYKTR